MAEPETPVLFLHAVERHYRQGDATLDILKGAELAVWPGQSVALIAPSGAGKSTLLHIAGLLEHQDSGEVYHRRDRDLRAQRRRAHPHPPQRDRFRLSGAPPAAGVLRAGERDAAADDPRAFAPGSRGAARGRAARAISASRSGSRIARPSCRAASSSGSRSPGRSPTRRASCSPTSRPETSIRAPPTTCSPP